MAISSDSNSEQQSTPHPILGRFVELEHGPWLFQDVPAAQPPPEAAKFVILIPLVEPPKETTITARVAVHTAAFLSWRDIAVAVVGLRPTTNLKHVFGLLKNADAVVVLMVEPYGPTTTDNLNPPWLAELFKTIVQFAHSVGVDQFYGITFGARDLPSSEFVEVAREPQPESEEQIGRVAAQLANYYIAQTAGVVAREEARKERQERIELNAAEYIEDAIVALRDRERRWKAIAHGSHAAGFVSLLGGIGAVLYFSAQGIDTVRVDIPWPFVVYVGLKSVIVVGLLVAASKYAFTVGRSYMNEALKNADRIHAINFGTFYLKAYGDTATWEELKEVFQHWNIAKDSGFAALDSSQFDPQLLTAAVEIAKNLSPSTRTSDTKK